MRGGLWLVTLLLPLSGCYAVSQDPGYGYAQASGPSGYPPPGYPPLGYPPGGYSPGGYAPLPYGFDAGSYPGYSYNGGAPTIVEGGTTVPLVLFGGQWGFYDRDRQWHHAPYGVSHDLEGHQAGGGHFHPDTVPHAGPYPPPNLGHFGGQAAFQPTEPPRPNAAPPVAPSPLHTERPERVQHDPGRQCPPGQRC